MKRIYLIDCPGVVPPSSVDTEEDILLRGVVRVENVENPAQYIPAVLRRAQTKHLERTYEIKHSEYNDDANEFLSILARKGGRLLRGGEADVDGVAKMVLNDFLRGKIPWFSAPPKKEGAFEAEKDAGVIDGREGRLGEMPSKGQKRKRNDVESGHLGPNVQEGAEEGVAELAATEEYVNNGNLIDDEDVVEKGSEDDGDNDGDDSDGEEGVELDGEAESVGDAEAPFEAFSSDEEGSGGVEAE
jgi:nuclear GTP-binding protein